MSKHFDAQVPIDGVVMVREESMGGYRTMALSVATPVGFVEVDITKKDTTLSIVWGGSLHRRTIDRVHTRAYAITLAKRFAREIVSTPTAAPDLSRITWVDSGPVVPAVNASDCSVCARSTEGEK